MIGKQLSLGDFLSGPEFNVLEPGVLSTQDLQSWLQATWDGTPSNKGNKGLVDPKYHAVHFYLLNHLVSIVRRNYGWNEALPPVELDVVADYASAVSDQARYAFFYLMLICVRESRHTEVSASMHIKIKKLFHPEVVSYLTGLKGLGSLDAAKTIRNDPLTFRMVDLLAAITYFFNHGSFTIGFGGKPWGVISGCLLEVLRGNTTLETMLDTSYTLAHNNGSIYNKGMLFSLPASTALLQVLDLQRSGQIPEWLFLEDNLGFPETKKYLPFFTKYRSEFGDYVSCKKIKDLGGLGAYKPFPSEVLYKKSLGGTDKANPAVTIDAPQKTHHSLGVLKLYDGLEVSTFLKSRAA